MSFQANSFPLTLTIFNVIMPRRTTVASLEEVELARDSVAEILSRYNNSRNVLVFQYNETHRLGRLNRSQVSRDRRRLEKLEHVIGRYEAAHLNERQARLHCSNCQRQQCHNEPDVVGISTNDPYHLHLVTISGDTVAKGKRQYKFCRYSKDPSVHYTICMQCKEYLCSPDRTVYNNFKNVWPSFIWSILSSQAVHQAYGLYVWRFIPLSWRSWWVDILRSQFRSVFDSITVEYPTPAFKDCTKEKNSFCEDINPTSNVSKGLQKLRDACNRHLFPSVLCPFGCTEYMHKTNHLSLMLVFQRYLPKVRLSLPCNKLKVSVQKLHGCRDDYIRNDGKPDIWLLNPNWKVLPSIAFDENKAPQILCCRHHNSATSGYMVHQPRHPGHILPAAMPDQLAHVCIKPRTVNQFRRNFGSNSYQMFRQDGSFNGIDTCSHTRFGRFDFCSYISSEDEALCLTHRPDCNALLTSLASEGVISDAIANDRRIAANARNQFLDYSDSTHGATYVPLQAAVQFLHDQSNANVVNITNDT